MKKRLFSILIVMAVVFSIIPSAVVNAAETVLDAQTNTDPYSVTNAMECYSYNQLNPGGNGGTEGNFMGGGRNGSYAVYKNMNFGTGKAGKIKVTCATSAAQRGTLQLRKGSTTGDIIAELESRATGDWTTPVTLEYTITNPQLATGVFDLYLVWSAEYANVFSFQFDPNYVIMNGPTLNMKTARNVATSVISQAAKISASFSIERNLQNVEEKKANLLLAEYDSNGSMLSLYEAGEQTVLNGGQATQFDIAYKSKKSATSGIGVYVWYEDDTILTNMYDKSVPALSGTASSNAIDAQADNGYVTIAGSNQNNERVIIAVVPDTYNAALPLYSQAVQIYETDITDGAYNYRFKMNENLATGDYYAIVKGETINLKKEFSFTNMSDIYNMLYILSTEADDDIVVSTVSQYADIFGTESAMFANMQDFDKANLNQKIKAFFAANPLTISTDYNEPWINGLKSVIIPEGVVSFMKNVKDAVKSAEYIKKYAVVLGISANQKFTNYFEDSKTEIAEAFIKNVAAASTASDFITLFEEAAIAGAFNAAPSWGYIDEALKEFATEIPVDLTIYNVLNNSAKADFAKKFSGQNFVTKLQIKDVFDRNISSYNTAENITEQKYKLMPLIAGNDEFTFEYWSEKKEEESGEMYNAIKDFEDLDSVPWAVDSIKYMRSMGYVNGKSDTAFAPGHNITREEFVAIIIRCFGFGEGDVNSLTFADVNKNEWYAPLVAKAVEKGIINGVSDDTFGTGEPITREQIAAIITRTANASNRIIWPKTSAIAFADGGYISEYAYDSVMTLAKAQVINGVGEDKFAPKKNASRAEAVVMLHRFLLNIM